MVQGPVALGNTKYQVPTFDKGDANFMGEPPEVNRLEHFWANHSPVSSVVVGGIPRRQWRDQPGHLLPHRLVQVLQRRRLVHGEDQRDPEQNRGVLLRR